jgi:hypothetical protein
MPRKPFSTGLTPIRNGHPTPTSLPADSNGDTAPITLNVQQVQGMVSNRFATTMASMQAVIEPACSMISAEWARARVTDIIGKAKALDTEWQALGEPERIALEPMLTDTARLLEGQLLECYSMSNPEGGRTEAGQREVQSLARKVMETVCPKYRPSAAGGDS